MSEQASAAKAEKPKAVPEPEPQDLTSLQSAEEVARGEWLYAELPNGATLRVRVSRAIGGHFQTVVTDVNRRFTKAGRVPLEKLTGAQMAKRGAELMARACLHDFARPVKIRRDGEEIVLRENTLETRIELLSVPDIYHAVDALATLTAEDYAEAVRAVGEG